MMGRLTAAQNILIGRKFKKGWLIDDGRMNAEASGLFEPLNMGLERPTPDAWRARGNASS
jgi:ABC-type sugar transport system ATPase subunit